jgi:iron complex outermembrane receptor protein
VRCRATWASPQFALVSLVYAAVAAAGADAEGLAEVGNGAASETVTIVATIPREAPSATPLDVIQPTSVVTREYIENNIPISGNYGDVVALLPSVMSISNNGSGNGDARITIRGFSDGQYDLTFDGIPFNVLTEGQRSSTFFVAHDLGGVSVDRGPGTASTVGFATFGGSLSLRSKDPLEAPTLTPYGEVGSFGTYLPGVELDSGTIAPLNGAAAYLDASYFRSDGYLTYSRNTRRDLFFKTAIPINDHTTITLVASNDREPVLPDSQGASLAQIASLGQNYGFTNDPTSQSYYRYYASTTHSDFEYLGLHAFGGIWESDSKLYTYGFYRQNLDGLDSSGGTPNGTFYGPNDVPGTVGVTDDRVFGGVFRLKEKLAFGDLEEGLWIDRQTGLLYGYNSDCTLSCTAPSPADSSAITHRRRKVSLLRLPTLSSSRIPLRTL